MEGRSRISDDVLGAYAADAACEVPGVRGLVEGGLPRHRGVKVAVEDGTVRVELHLALEWGAKLAAVGTAVQTRVADYLDSMADMRPERVDVVIDEVGAPPATA